MNSPSSLSHARAALGMICVTLLWSTAGVVSRSLQAAESFEVTFFRSLSQTVSSICCASWMSMRRSRRKPNDRRSS